MVEVSHWFVSRCRVISYALRRTYRGTIRRIYSTEDGTYGTDKNLQISLFLLTIFGPIYCLWPSVYFVSPALSTTAILMVVLGHFPSRGFIGEITLCGSIDSEWAAYNLNVFAS